MCQNIFFVYTYMFTYVYLYSTFSILLFCLRMPISSTGPYFADPRSSIG